MTDAPQKPLSKKAAKQAEKIEAIQHLRKLLKPGDTVHTVLRHCSSSGMSRRIDLFKMSKDGPIFLTGYVGRAIDYKHSDKGGLVVGGCGMDMGFAIVYALSHALYPKGFKLAKDQRGRNGDTSGFDSDGGYALRHSWL